MKFSTKKFISIFMVIAYVVFVGYLLYIRIDKVPTEFVSFTGMVNLIVGAYFGNSIAKENQSKV